MIDYTARWMLENLPDSDRIALVHNDFRNGNLMIRPETGVVAVLDWEVATLGDPMRDLGWICTNSWRFGVSHLPVGGFDWDPSRAFDTKMIGELIGHVNQTTRAQIARIVNTGINEGAAVNQIQSQIRKATAFSPQRALLVARTESTRAVNSGTQMAYASAADAGVNVKKQWLSARDGEVRDDHTELDGQTVGVSESFSAPSGATAAYPGDFGDPAMDCNCRCSTIPIIED